SRIPRAFRSLVPAHLGSSLRRIDDGLDRNHLAALCILVANRSPDLFLLQPQAQRVRERLKALFFSSSGAVGNDRRWLFKPHRHMQAGPVYPPATRKPRRSLPPVKGILKSSRIHRAFAGVVEITRDFFSAHSGSSKPRTYVCAEHVHVGKNFR